MAECATVRGFVVVINVIAIVKLLMSLRKQLTYCRFLIVQVWSYTYNGTVSLLRMTYPISAILADDITEQ